MSRISITDFSTPYGELLLGSFGDRLCLCDWKQRTMRQHINRRIREYHGADFREGTTPVLLEAQKQLAEYFRRERERFELPLSFTGTEFQEQVWNLVREIPYGRTETYTGLAAKLNNPGSVRAVAAANGANALAILVPCHRVIGSNGEMTGYAGGTRVKKRLLGLEQSLSQGELDLF